MQEKRALAITPVCSGSRVILVGSKELLNEVEMAFELRLEGCPNGEGRKRPCLNPRRRQEEHALRREQPEQRHQGKEPEAL